MITKAGVLLLQDAEAGGFVLQTKTTFSSLQRKLFPDSGFMESGKHLGAKTVLGSNIILEDVPNDLTVP